MKIRLLTLAFALLATSPLARASKEERLPLRVMAILDVSTKAQLGSREFDETLLARFRDLGGRKEILSYISTRSEQDDLIVSAEWHQRSLHLWFGANEDGVRIECDVYVHFMRDGKIEEARAWTTRRAEPNPEEWVRQIVEPSYSFDEPKKGPTSR